MLLSLASAKARRADFDGRADDEGFGGALGEGAESGRGPVRSGVTSAGLCGLAPDLSELEIHHYFRINLDRVPQQQIGPIAPLLHRADRCRS
jgi:hypothetical protein